MNEEGFGGWLKGEEVNRWGVGEGGVLESMSLEPAKRPRKGFVRYRGGVDILVLVSLNMRS